MEGRPRDFDVERERAEVVHDAEPHDVDVRVQAAPARHRFRGHGRPIVELAVDPDRVSAAGALPGLDQKEAGHHEGNHIKLPAGGMQDPARTEVAEPGGSDAAEPVRQAVRTAQTVRDSVRAPQPIRQPVRSAEAVRESVCPAQLVRQPVRPAEAIREAVRSTKPVCQAVRSTAARVRPTP